MANTDILFTYDEAIRTMGVTPERMEKLIDEGKIRTIGDRPRVFIPRQSILDYFTEAVAAKKKK
jgi:hypothetical protein